MIDHAAARDLGITAIDFGLDAVDQAALDDHLRDCAACRHAGGEVARDARRLRDLDLGPLPVAVRAHIAIVAERREGASRSGWVLLAAAAALLVVVLGGLATGIGSRPGGNGGDGTGISAPLGRAVDWMTPVVHLEVADFWLEAAGRRWVPPPDAAVQVSSDPGDATYWTLEIIWFEGQVEQRMNLYFASDGATWQITEARIYDGRAPAEWLSAQGSFARTPIGRPYEGDLTIDVRDAARPDAGPGRIVMRSATLAVAPGGWAVPGGGGAPVPADPNAPIVVPVDPASGAAIDCGPVGRADCTTMSSRALEFAGRQFPDRMPVLIRITSATGSFELTLDDGSVHAITVD